MKKNFLFMMVLSFIVQSQSFAATTVNGAGSTFAEPIYTKWFSEYQKTNKDAQFNYQGIGSGAGIKQLLAGTVDFAGSDDPMNAEDSAKAKSTVLHIPVAMGAVVVSYNLKLDTKEPIKMTGPVLAKIFAGQITKWNDKEIKDLNKDLKLPDMNITVATRSDSSGTTAVFTDYLSKVSPEWVGKNGKTVNWFSGSLGAKGNSGVAGLITQSEGAIGYVELVYAQQNNLPMVLLKNKSGKYVRASTESVTAAAEKLTKETLKKDFKISMTDSSAPRAYPISAFTWMLVYQEMTLDKGAPIVSFAKWALSEDAQKMASLDGYAAVPKDIRTAALKKVGEIHLK